MASIYHSVAPNADLNCGICLEPLSAKVVAHDKGGEFHPVHEKCISRWVIKHPNCPDCRKKIDQLSLPLIKEKFEARNQAECQKLKNSCKTLGKLVLAGTITVASALTAYTQEFQSPFPSDSASIAALVTATAVVVLSATSGTLVGAVQRPRECNSFADAALKFAATCASSTVAFVAYKVLF